MFDNFFSFAKWNCSVGLFDSHACKGKEWKAILKEWLNLLKLMKNPKSFYCGQFLKDVLQHRLMCNSIMYLILQCFFHMVFYFKHTFFSFLFLGIWQAFRRKWYWNTDESFGLPVNLEGWLYFTICWTFKKLD